METFEDAGIFGAVDTTSTGYVEHLRRPDLSLGTYSLRAGADDLQEPHTEDEVYVVTAGRARFTSSGETIDVAAGSVFFVAAHEVHRFHDITEDLAVPIRLRCLRHEYAPNHRRIEAWRRIRNSA